MNENKTSAVELSGIFCLDRENFNRKRTRITHIGCIAMALIHIAIIATTQFIVDNNLYYVCSFVVGLLILFYPLFAQELALFIELHVIPFDFLVICATLNTLDNVDDRRKSYIVKHMPENDTYFIQCLVDNVPVAYFPVKTIKWSSIDLKGYYNIRKSELIV